VGELITLLISAEVHVMITTDGAGWHAHGHLISDQDEERKWFAFLCEHDPFFALRFADESTFAVAVHLADDGQRFTLTEDTGPVHRQTGQRIEY
jgi:hypothetical protein